MRSEEMSPLSEQIGLEVHDVFDEKKNKTFRFGKVSRWILKSNDGKLLGRIAAFTNKKYRNNGLLWNYNLPNFI